MPLDFKHQSASNRHGCRCHAALLGGAELRNAREMVKDDVEMAARTWRHSCGYVSTSPPHRCKTTAPPRKWTVLGRARDDTNQSIEYLNRHLNHYHYHHHHHHLNRWSHFIWGGIWV